MVTIGVISIDPWFMFERFSLQRDLLYFDRLLYTMSHKDTLELFCTTLTKSPELFEKKMQEIEVFKKAGLLIEYDENNKVGDETFRDESTKQLALKEHDLASEYLRTQNTLNKGLSHFFETFRYSSQLNARYYSLILNRKYSDEFIPILNNSYINLKPDQIFSKSDVLSVVLKRFPIVDNQMPIEQLVEFKSDPEVALGLSRLKNWVQEISRDNYSDKEIEQKLDYLLHEYQNQLKIHKMKYHLGTVESIVTVSLEVIESIVKLNFSKAAKLIFDLRRLQLTLSEAEDQFKGKEIAIIQKINEKFRSEPSQL